MVFSLSLHVGKLISVSPLPGLRRTPNAAALLSLSPSLSLSRTTSWPGTDTYARIRLASGNFPTHSWRLMSPWSSNLRHLPSKYSNSNQPAQRVKHRTILIYLVYSSPSSCIHSYHPLLSRNGKEPMEMIRHIQQSAVSVGSSYGTAAAAAASRRRQTALQQ